MKEWQEILVNILEQSPGGKPWPHPAAAAKHAAGIFHTTAYSSQ